MDNHDKKSELSPTEKRLKKVLREVLLGSELKNILLKHLLK